MTQTLLRSGFGYVDRTDARNEMSVKVEACPEFLTTTFMRWRDASMTWRALERGPATVREEGGKLIWTNGDLEIHQYPRPEVGQWGGWESEWVIPRPPRSNVMRLACDLVNLEWWPQPDGSAALYHSSRGVFVNMAGPNYGCGKFGHVERPLMVDAVGQEAWGELRYENGVISVIIPPAFLRKVIFPLRVDPTFGYTSIGATSSWSLNGFINMGRASISEDGTGTSLSIYTNVSFGSTSGKCNVYQDETGGADVNVALLANGATVENTSMPTTAQWVTQNYTTPPSFVNGAFYRMAGWTNNVTAAYSDAGAGEHMYFISKVYGAWPDPSGTLTDNAHRMSIYTTYTAASTGQPTMRRWGGVPFVGGRGVNNAGGNSGRMWGHRRSGVIVPRHWLGDEQKAA